MARPHNGERLTIAELERMLDFRRGKLSKLEKDRARLQRKLDDLDARIRLLNGGAGGVGARSASGRAQNPQSLVATMESILREAGKPLAVGDILQKVHAAGYRSNSANFRALINQTLIKDKRFTAADRGVYQLKK